MMKPWINNYIYILLLTLLAGISNSVWADTAPRIYIQATRHLQAGRIADGTRVAQGVIASDMANNGLVVRLNNQESERSVASYLVKGMNNPNHRLRVRIQSDNSSQVIREADSNDLNQNGLRLMPSSHQALFYIVTDGNQELAADIYHIDASGFTITQE